MLGTTLVAVLAGCGGSQVSNETREAATVRGLVERYVSAIAHGDFARACSLSTEGAQGILRHEAAGYGARASTCADAWTELQRKGLQVANANSAVRIGAIVVHGAVASIEVMALGKSYPSYAVREDGQWKLAESKGAP